MMNETIHVGAPFGESLHEAVTGLSGGLSFDYLGLLAYHSWADVPDGHLLGELIDCDYEIGKPLAEVRWRA
jgi:hypothetical protein